MEEWTRHFFWEGAEGGWEREGTSLFGKRGRRVFFFTFQGEQTCQPFFCKGRSVFFFLSRFISFCDGGRRGGLQFDQPTRVSQRNTFRWTLFKRRRDCWGVDTLFREEEESWTRPANSKMPQLLEA